ncbi:MAG TPA: FadR/GntR family transcriptional regulator [Burkholderiales bacterium]|nr:FadR/GntR family transcriptional regulator [Burkholderiales bacterium]
MSLKPANLTDQLSSAMTERIAAGVFAPGSRLPTEQALSSEFGVSRTVVREAISRLKSEGLVETRQGSGAFVAQSKLGIPFRIDPVSVESFGATVDILELRLAVESEAAALAAERASADQLAAIRRALDAVRAAFERGDDGVDEDLAFHRAIAEATHNSKYVDLAEFLERYVRRQIQITGGRTARASRMGETQSEHRKIFEAIAARDGDAARASAREHFRKGIERIRRSREKEEGR